MNNQRNILTAVLLTGLILFGWDAAIKHFYPNANKPAPVASAPPTSGAAQSGAAPTRDGGLISESDRALEAKDLKLVLAAPGRVPVDAPGLSGSINTVGAVIDDITTKRHTDTIKQGSGLARIFSPKGTPAQHFAQFGWAGDGTPNAQTQWAVSQGAKLTPQTPVTLTWANASGQTFAITYAIDADYMITVTQKVINTGAAPVKFQPVAQINRTKRTASLDTWNVHSGPLLSLDESVYFAVDYAEIDKATNGRPDLGWSIFESRPQYDEKPGSAKGIALNPGKTDWIGFTDIYWMTTLIPDKAAVSSDYRALGRDIYLANVLYGSVNIAPGQQVASTTRLFAGAKESSVLDRYEAAGISHFGLAIDWGWFRFFEKPIFALMKMLFQFTNNFGLAIILLTLIVRALMFPIAQRQFASMAAMRAIQPKQKALQERYKDDREKLQQETMKLYKEEGVNPLSGCLPIFLQIPIFFALYKVLMLAIEMRHQPFIGWIKDLSAPDPLHILNLFGLLPFTPPSFLGIGILAVLLGVTMWFQFKLNPSTPDPVQQQIMGLMPWIMMFVMAPFAAGMLIYWITSNLLTIAQQKYLYSRHPVLQAQAEKDAEDVKRAKALDKA